MSKTKNPENMTKQQLIEILRKLIEEVKADETMIGVPNILLDYNLISQKEYDEITGL